MTQKTNFFSYNQRDYGYGLSLLKNQPVGSFSKPSIFLDGPYFAPHGHVRLRMAMRRARRWLRSWWPVVVVVVVIIFIQVALYLGYIPPEWP